MDGAEAEAVARAVETAAAPTAGLATVAMVLGERAAAVLRVAAVAWVAATEALAVTAATAEPEAAAATRALAAAMDREVRCATARDLVVERRHLGSKPRRAAEATASLQDAQATLRGA